MSSSTRRTNATNLTDHGVLSFSLLFWAISHERQERTAVIVDFRLRPCEMRELFEFRVQEHSH